MPIISKKVVSVMEERLRSQDTMTRWQNWLNDNEPDFMTLITSIANNHIANITQRGERWQLSDLLGAMLGVGIASVMTFIQGANDVNLSKLNVDLISVLGASNQEQLYARWKDGMLPDEYYDPSLMGEGSTECDDWNTAVSNHEEVKKNMKNVKSKREIVSKLLPFKDTPQPQRPINPPDLEEEKVEVPVVG